MKQYGPQLEKNCLWGFANNKGADQPVHPHRLICAFVILVLECTISRLATSKISIFQLVSVTEETGLSLAKDRSCRVKAYILTALEVLDTVTTAVSDVTKLFMWAGFVSIGPITSQNA